MSLSRLELDTPWRLPRRDVPVVLYDDGEGLVEQAGRRLRALGYTQVFVLEGGLAGWRDSGAELFGDVNSPSKAFGELVEHERHTPSLAAEEVKALLDEGADVVVLDARRFDEYQTMSIPTGTSVPGAKLALRVRDLAPDPKTRVIVNCAGRTRSIIGTQSLVNAGIPNPVSALRKGTIGWALARRAGVERLSPQALDGADPPNRTVYRYDVRSPEEYAAGHLPGFGSAPGGQLVQETDVFARVRGAGIAQDGSPPLRADMWHQCPGTTGGTRPGGTDGHPRAGAGGGCAMTCSSSGYMNRRNHCFIVNPMSKALSPECSPASHPSMSEVVRILSFVNILQMTRTLHTSLYRHPL